MNWGSTALPSTIMAVDIASFGSKTRNDHNRLAARDGMYRVLTTAFVEAEVPLERCPQRDSGDGALILLPPDIAKIHLVDRLPHRIAVGLRRHNDDHSEAASVHLRIALHAGEVRSDPNGFVGDAVNYTFRILDAQQAKNALASSKAELVLIVSDWFYQSVVRNDPAAESDEFEQIDVAVKETQATAWIRLLGGRPAEPRPDSMAKLRSMKLADLGEVVDLLAQTPGFAAREDRDLVLEQLDPTITTMIKRYPASRADIASIVLACRHYDGAWGALLEAIRLFAAGSTAMKALDRRAGLGGPEV